MRGRRVRDVTGEDYETSFELVAEFRETQGKGASRRLRHDGKVPAILYGGHADARTLTLNHQKLLIMLDNERFYSTFSAEGGGSDAGGHLEGRAAGTRSESDRARRLPASRGEREDSHQHSAAFHRRGGVSGGEIPGGIVSHMRNETEVTCLPKDLPEFIEVDISDCLSMRASTYRS